jgi:hypothetical protein
MQASFALFHDRLTYLRQVLDEDVLLLVAVLVSCARELELEEPVVMMVQIPASSVKLLPKQTKAAYLLVDFGRHPFHLLHYGRYGCPLWNEMQVAALGVLRFGHGLKRLSHGPLTKHMND